MYQDKENDGAEIAFIFDSSQKCDVQNPKNPASIDSHKTLEYLKNLQKRMTEQIGKYTASLSDYIRQKSILDPTDPASLFERIVYVKRVISHQQTWLYRDFYKEKYEQYNALLTRHHLDWYKRLIYQIDLFLFDAIMEIVINIVINKEEDLLFKQVLPCLLQHLHNYDPELHLGALFNPFETIEEGLPKWIALNTNPSKLLTSEQQQALVSLLFTSNPENARNQNHPNLSRQHGGEGSNNFSFNFPVEKPPSTSGTGCSIDPSLAFFNLYNCPRISDAMGNPKPYTTGRTVEESSNTGWAPGL